MVLMMNMTTKFTDMTKQQARARKASWQQGINEGRIVRWNDTTGRGVRFVCYVTAEDAQRVVDGLRREGCDACIVAPEGK